MGTIGIIKPLSTVLSSAVNKSQQHKRTNSWEHRESSPVLLDLKRDHYQLCYSAPFFYMFAMSNELIEKVRNFVQINFLTGVSRWMLSRGAKTRPRSTKDRITVSRFFFQGLENFFWRNRWFHFLTPFFLFRWERVFLSFVAAAAAARWHFDPSCSDGQLEEKEREREI